ncbi:MAG TPA: RNA 2'-phosphotransferase [Flavisolibacter sp.]|nr:RNA 2'-phosphotransferase [Flavisolibacter sp.]
MNNEKNTVRISKFMSLVLRHKPQTIGLTVDENGWAATNDLIEKMNANGHYITPDILNYVVATNDKKRFSFNEDKSKIRASQGHSINVDLALKETDPPACLYHGTGEKYVESILKTGLQKKTRQHVHLSQDTGTARTVGQRHGRPVIFTVAAEQMKGDGFTFYLSENHVWLTDFVPLKYLQLIK